MIHEPDRIDAGGLAAEDAIADLLEGELDLREVDAEAQLISPQKRAALVQTIFRRSSAPTSANKLSIVFRE